MDKIELIKNLLEVMEGAIRSGDWKVDGACDPSSAMADAEDAMREAGYRLDGITGTEWIFDA